MGDIMRQIPFSELLERVFGEFKQSQSIFGIPAKQFYQQPQARDFSVWGEQCATPVGPAAGPHTQLSQNIIASWLAGGRFIELKTVQKLDQLEIAKPCIDAEDECFNTEWSTEFTLPKAFDEYLKAWFALHLLEGVFAQKQPGDDKSFVFNISVGYDLEGIKTAPMQEYIDNMLDASNHPKFAQYQQELKAFVQHSELLDDWDRSTLSALVEQVPTQVTQGVTLSTLHGCPSHEIESICRYMLEEKGINTYVKLNPTLLGYQRVRYILDQAGFDYIALSEEAFLHDLQMNDAKAMLHRLVDLGKEKGLGFGVKLTNTLGTLNNKGRLPDKEMYMSGRALFPLSINVALELSKEFDGQLPISYSGGASKFNISEIFATGIRPITMATDLLKPGGYLRLAGCAQELDNSQDWTKTCVDVDKLEQLATKALSADYVQKEWRGPEEIQVDKAVPLTDCSVAPCVAACPISQDIPEYVRLVGEQRYVEALDLIYARNALPSITGHICDHQCQYNCTRRDYEGAVNIREMKKIALEQGWQGYRDKWHQPSVDSDKPSIAVIGAGPAGLSAGYFMARAGYPVTIFEKERSAGGVVKHIIPEFRIPAAAIEHDIQFVQDHGVQIEYGASADITVETLKQSGFKYICLGIGADKGNPISLAGENSQIYKSLDFLRSFNRNQVPNLGKNIVVIGAGNTAMDSARAALKVEGVEKVTVVYRRTEAEMPAYKEEYLEAVEDGVEFLFLASPERFEADGQLLARVMTLGEPDEQGRCRPLATQDTVTIEADSVITAIGEQANTPVLEQMGVPMGVDGWPVIDNQTGETQVDNVFLLGDSKTGPSSIVSAIQGARQAALAILSREGESESGQVAMSGNELTTDLNALYQRKGMIEVNVIEPQSLKAEQHQVFAEQESARCLECSYVCSKCVDVCPNRANVSLPIAGFKDALQVMHIDAYCNECGNCAQFCPWDSKPYKDKFTLYNLEQDFHSSTNPGFWLVESNLWLRVNGEVHCAELDESNEFKLPQGLEKEQKIIQHVIQNHRYLLGEVSA